MIDHEVNQDRCQDALREIHRTGQFDDATWRAQRIIGPSALAYPADASGPGPGSGAFPPMIYRVNSLTLGVTIPFSPRLSMRVFDYYERGRISDWHYQGLDTRRVIGNRVYIDGGPESYSANLLGIMLNVQL